MSQLFKQSTSIKQGTPMDTVEIDGKKYAITGHDHNGTPVIKGHATTVHHKDENGKLMYDKDGNPVKSVHVSVSPIEPITEKEQ